MRDKNIFSKNVGVFVSLNAQISPFARDEGVNKEAPPPTPPEERLSFCQQRLVCIAGKWKVLFTSLHDFLVTFVTAHPCHDT